MAQINKKRVVIVGGGFAGVNVAKDLLHQAPGRFSISIIDKKDYHFFTPAFFKAATSLLEPSKIFSAVAFKFADIFEGFRGVEVFTKEIKDIEFEKRMLVFKGDRALSYDFLVLTPGLETDFGNVAGAKEYALPSKTFEDAIGIKSRLDEVVKNKAKKEDVRVIIVGAGLTGVGLAGELSGYLANLAAMYGHPKESLRTKLVSGSDKILASKNHVWMGRMSEKRLGRLGVEIVLGARVEEVGKNEVVFKNGSREKCDVLIWTAGVAKCDFSKKFELSSGPALRMDHHKNVFVLGDAAGEGTTQTAICQARYAARVILGENKYKYKSPKPVFINTVGKNFALADFGFLKIQGKLAYFVKNMACFNYFARIFSWRKAFEAYKRYKSL